MKPRERRPRAARPIGHDRRYKCEDCGHRHGVSGKCFELDKFTKTMCSCKRYKRRPK